MTALPASTLATASTATEGDVKNFLTGQRDYLSGLFGDTGVAADARAALGVTALTSANITTALGYTPAATGGEYTWTSVWIGTTTSAIAVRTNYGEGIYKVNLYGSTNQYIFFITTGGIVGNIKFSEGLSSPTYMYLVDGLAAIPATSPQVNWKQIWKLTKN